MTASVQKIPPVVRERLLHMTTINSRIKKAAELENSGEHGNAEAMLTEALEVEDFCLNSAMTCPRR